MTAMIRNLGDELALVLDQEILRINGIDEDTPHEVVVDENGIHIRPVSSVREAMLLASASLMMDIHDETFRKLAQ